MKKEQILKVILDFAAKKSICLDNFYCISAGSGGEAALQGGFSSALVKQLTDNEGAQTNVGQNGYIEIMFTFNDVQFHVTLT